MQDRPCVAVAPTIGGDQFSHQGELGLLPARDAWQPRAIEPLLKLGAGRAAEAFLVRGTDATGGERLCVEKVFKPGWLTRFIYRCGFQSPFAYQHCEDAILACFYRRRVAATLVDVFVPDARVAVPLYARWDRESRAFVLGAEFIRGRGIRPAVADSRWLRNKLRHWRRPDEPRETPPAEEIEQLLRLMNRLEALFRDCGLVGSGWQVSQAAIVATANLLRTESGYVVVDLESGIPATLVPYYIAAARRLRSLPLFDDCEPRQLRKFLEANWPQLSARLGRARYQQLADDAESLIHHTGRWKEAEIALGRRGRPRWSAAFRTAYRERRIDIWRRGEIIDGRTEKTLRSSSRLWSRPLYWLGFIPGAPGRYLQRLCGNAQTRCDTWRAICQPAYRRELVADYCAEKTARWREAGRIAPEREFTPFSPRFFAHALLAKFVPSGVHRWLTDAKRRRTSLARIVLLAASERFQREYGQQAIRRAIRQWTAAGRLHPQEHAALQSELQSHELDEYARCFGMHLSLKFVAPILVPMKIGGIAAFFGTGDPLYLLPILIAPGLRTAITLWRMMRNGWRGVKYGEALLVGALPVVGSLAFPVQMYAAHKNLASFLIRDNAARLARWIPVYGGRDSRVEIAGIKAANLPIEMLEIGLAAMARLRRWLPSWERDRIDAPPAETVPASRWRAWVDHHVALLNAAEAEQQPISERIEELLEQQSELRKAS